MGPGGRGVAEVVVGHMCKPVVTDDGDVAVECHSIDVVGDRVARDHNRRRHCNREQHDPCGRHYAGIRVTGKVVLSDPVPTTTMPLTSCMGAWLWRTKPAFPLPLASLSAKRLSYEPVPG